MAVPLVRFGGLVVSMGRFIAVACALLVAVLLCVLRKTDDLMYDDHPLYNSVKEERERQLSVGVQSPGGTLRDPTTGAAVPSLARSASAEERFRKRAYNVGEKLMQCFALRNLLSHYHWRLSGRDVAFETMTATKAISTA